MTAGQFVLPIVRLGIDVLQLCSLALVRHRTGISFFF
jgi:hypothetical protein